MPDPDTPSDLSDPRGIAVDGTGAIYVSDAERDRILVFGEAGEARFEFGLYGSAPGSFMDPWGLAFDARRDRLYVADSGNARVQVFDRLGVSLASWPLEEGSRPAGLAVDDAGRVWVADPGTNRILAFDHEGRLLVAAPSGEGFGPFRGPLDVAAGAGNLVIVADSGSGRVGVFAPHPALGGAKGP
jgi:DNA-binding beta-propeller fold protein YncE